MTNKYPLLDNISFPRDLKKIPQDQLPLLAQEIRQRIVEVTSSTGGHIASSLGAVELIIALHYCLDTPKDKIVFDVGHQAYAHKILTGRHLQFSTLRQYQGLSGFPCQEESAYDVFTTGHSSTAVSLALGLTCGRDLLAPNEQFKIVAVIGDGSLSGGLCFEGLNNAGHLKKDILVILNTNELSISPNVGALSNYLNKLISLPIYNHFRTSLQELLESRIPKGKRLIKLANKFEEGLKGLFTPGIFFEELGFRYFGPLNGHDLHNLIPTLKNILAIKGPRLLHIVTKKGKGYLPAENEPVKFHGTGPFDIETGRPLSDDKIRPKTYTEVFGNKLLTELTRGNKKIIAITAAMPEGTGLEKIRDFYPEHFFDVGIAEEHALCFAAGLAKEGLKPVVAVYSTFLQRAYDQIIEDVALQKANVLLAIDRAGIVGEDGFTHQGIFDIAYLRNVPNMVVMAPRDEKEFELMIEFGLNLDQPAAIRYPRSSVPLSTRPVPKIELGKSEILKEADEIFIIAFGSMVLPCLEAAEILEKEGIKTGLINSRFARPLDKELLERIGQKVKFIFTVEEGIVDGGFGSAVAELVNREVFKIGLPCEFIVHGKRDILLEKYKLDKEGIVNRIREVIKYQKRQ